MPAGFVNYDAEDGDGRDGAPPGQVGWFEIFRYCTFAERWALGLGAICAFLAGTTTPLFSFFFGRMINGAYAATNSSNVTRSFATLMTCIAIVTCVLSLIHNSVFLGISNRQIGRLRCAYFAALLNHDIVWHDNHKPGELMARMSSDMRVVQDGISDRLAGSLSGLGTCILGFIFGFVSSWQIALTIMAAAPVIIVVIYFLSSAASRYVVEGRQQYTVAGSLASEVMENIKTVQTFNREEYESDRYAISAIHSRASGVKKEFIVGLTGGLMLCIVFCTLGCSFLLASYLVEHGIKNAGLTSSALLGVLYGSQGLMQIVPGLSTLMEARSVAFPIFATIDAPPAIDIYAPGEEPTFDERIVFDDVSFVYPTRVDQYIFRNLSFTIEKGDKIAFSGSTGCGKSTILALLQRFYDPTSGAVLVDGKDLRDVALYRWRHRIAVVSQEPNLFTGSVFENVRMGVPEATMDDVVQACKMANIHDTIVTLPRGYTTSVGSVGGQLSGGQKQRLAIARAIVRHAELLLLDEATSALDRKSEIEVQRAIDNITQQGRMTVVTIAHRLSTIRNMDRIYFLHNEGDGSYIAEWGTYDELMALGGQFASMSMMQGAAKEVTGACDELHYQAAESPTLDQAATPVCSDDAAGGMPHSSDSDTSIFSRWASNDEDEGGSMRTPTSSVTRSKPSQSDAESRYTADSVPLSAMTDEQSVPFELRTKWETRQTRVPFVRLFHMSREHTWAILLGFLGSILTAIAMPACSMVLSQLISIVGLYQVDRDARALHRRVAIYVSIFCAIGLISLFGSLLTAFYGYVGEFLTYRLRTLLFRQILRQDQTFFDMPSRDTGSLSALLSGDCEAVHQLYGPALGSRLKSAFSLAAGIVIGVIFQWKVALVSLATMPIMVAGIFAQQIFLNDREKASDHSNVDVLTSESLSAIRTVQGLNLVDVFILQYKRLVNKEFIVSEKRTVLISITVALTDFVSLASVALAFWYGGTLIEKGETTYSNVMVTVMVVMMGSLFAGYEAGSFATKMRDARKAARNVFAVIDRVPDVDSFEYGDIDIGDGCDIVFRDVDFHYPARDQVNVLRSLDLNFESGSSNGLMGQTGCGKSTIIQLLARFYRPDGGTIYVNGKDLNNFDVVTWRDNISAVLQEPSLFSGTIRDNIKYSLPDATDDEMVAAAKVACIHDEIMQMDDGYETQVGYNGRELSGGQRQRVAIARGVLRCPKLLLLDEATSALDNATEAAVQQNINDYQRTYGVTTVSIAHRLTTIVHCDQITLLDNGKIIEQGTHEELLALNGEYRLRWQLTQQ